MKKYWIVLLLAGAALFPACHSEDAITPRDDNPFDGNFAFPEGNDPWDHTAQEIYDKFGVQLIYKNIDSENINRRWNLGAVSYLNAQGLDPEQARYHVDFMKDHIFNYFTPELTHGIFLPYYLLPYDLHSLTGTYKSYVSQYLNGRDSWISCLFNEQSEASKKPPLSEAALKQHRIVTIFLIFEKMIARQRIAAPVGFDDLFNYVKKPESYAIDDPDYFVTRGYIGEPDYYNYSLPGYFSWDYNNKPWTGYKQFRAYLFSCIRYSDEELRAIFPNGDFTKIQQGRDMMREHFKAAYSIDLEAIRTGPQ